MAGLTGFSSSFAQSEAQRFPKMEAKSLRKEKITFPDDLNGEVNILTIVFQQQAQLIVDTWAEIILEEYEPLANITYHEIPMISGLYIPIAWQVDNWMRAGIPESYHDNTTTFYGNRRPYIKALEMDQMDSCYVFILDQAGNIRFRTEGRRDPAKEKAFRNAIASLSTTK